MPLMILGDAAYPLLPWLMKPFREGRGVTAEQINFNHRLSQARMTVERAFGRLKGRRRCLLKQHEAHISLVSQIISACCVLHNFCEVNNEIFNDEDNEEDEGEENELDDRQNCEETGDQSGQDIRNALCAYFSRL